MGSLTLVDKTYLIRIIKLLIVLPAIALPFLISQALAGEIRVRSLRGAQ
jgi:hypothetical protein